MRGSVKTRLPKPLSNKTTKPLVYKSAGATAVSLATLAAWSPEFLLPTSSLLMSEPILFLGACPSPIFSPVCLHGAAPTSPPARKSHVSLAYTPFRSQD